MAHALSLSANADSAAVIYDVPKFAGDDVTTHVEPLLVYPYEPVPDLKKPPTRFNVEELPDYYLHAIVLSHGTEQYELRCYVTAPDLERKLVLKGCFRWNPTITVA